jgi:plasmid maintenance system antidote protein VapI
MRIDAFELLGAERRPNLDPAVVDRMFQQISRERHPDSARSGDLVSRRDAESHYADLNEAAQILRDPVKRLRHLLELERGITPGVVDRVPSSVMDLFMEVAGGLKRIDALMNRKQQVQNPLLKATLFKQALDLTPEIAVIQAKVAQLQNDLGEQLRNLDRQWDVSDREAMLDQLEDIYRGLSHTQKWTAQLSERLFLVQSPD